MIRLKYLLLPIAGGLSAFFSFLFAAPYVKSLHRVGLKPGDPLLDTTFGTVWSNVQHATFGILLVGSFCLILESGRRSWTKIFQATMLGMLLGGLLNSLADSGSDYIGLCAQRTMGSFGTLIGAGAWLILVPFAMAISVAFALGMTGARFARAIYATMIAAILTFLAKIVGMVAVAGMSVSTLNIGDALNGAQQSSLEKYVPAFLIEAIAVGVALGLTMARADRVSRAGSLRLVYGRKEYKDWSLDHSLNRLGSSEVEIPIYGFKGVEPVHACIFKQDSQFIFDSQHFPGFVNGVPVAQALLNNGDMLQIGEAQLVFYSKGAVRSQTARAPIQPHVMITGQPMAQPFGQPIQPQPQVMIVPNLPPMAGAPLGNASPVVMPDPLVPVMSTSQVRVPIVHPQMATSRFHLIDSTGKEYPLQGGLNTVGREVGNVVCIPTNSTVSRSHAVIEIADEVITVTDVGSANGSGLNGIRIESPVEVHDGDTIAFGSTSLTLRVLPADP